MKKSKKLTFGVLNIKIHPHTPNMYVELMNEVFEHKQEVQIRGSDWGIPSSIEMMDDQDALEGLYGKFYRFLQIDENQPWLDLIKGATIKDDDGNPIPQVDSHKKPNTKDVWFAFFPKKHRLIFDAKMISPNMAKAFFDQQFRQDYITNKYGSVDVIIESSFEAIDKILAIPMITNLQIIISKPNPDDFDGHESRFKARLDTIGASKVTEEYKARKGETLRPDDEIRTHMNIARSNGSVRAEGYDLADQKIVESTDPHPLIVVDTYDPNNMTFIGGFIEGAKRVLMQIQNTLP